MLFCVLVVPYLTSLTLSPFISLRATTDHTFFFIEFLLCAGVTLRTGMSFDIHALGLTGRIDGREWIALPYSIPSFQYSLCHWRLRGRLRESVEVHANSEGEGCVWKRLEQGMCLWKRGKRKRCELPLLLPVSLNLQPSLLPSCLSPPGWTAPPSHPVEFRHLEVLSGACRQEQWEDGFSFASAWLGLFLHMATFCRFWLQWPPLPLKAQVLLALSLPVMDLFYPPPLVSELIFECSTVSAVSCRHDVVSRFLELIHFYKAEVSHLLSDVSFPSPFVWVWLFQILHVSWIVQCLVLLCSHTYWHLFLKTE